MTQELPGDDLTLRALMSAMTAAPTSEARAAAAPDAQPAPPDSVAAALHQTRTSADLFGFQISARRPILGMRSVKRLLRRLQYQVFDRQTSFNQAAAHLFGRLVGDAARHERMLSVALGAIDTAEGRLQGIGRRLDESAAHSASLAETVERIEVRLNQATLPRPEDLDYVGLQDHFRGDPDEITARQREYVDLFAPGGSVLDIGCGRGEFMTLLRDSGRAASGVDTDAQMVALSRDLGFEVDHDDGVHHLLGRPDDGLDGVFAAQVVEHMPPGQIAHLVQLCLRKLRPGGVLLLETVNPTSLVALMNFYLDFTHVAPIHPMALQWLAQSAGFGEVEILYRSPVEGGPRLQSFPGTSSDPDAQKAFDDAIAATNEVLYGPRDYAIVARKP